MRNYATILPWSWTEPVRREVKINKNWSCVIEDIEITRYSLIICKVAILLISLHIDEIA